MCVFPHATVVLALLDALVDAAVAEAAVADAAVDAATLAVSSFIWTSICCLSFSVSLACNLLIYHCSLGILSLLQQVLLVCPFFPQT